MLDPPSDSISPFPPSNSARFFSRAKRSRVLRHASAKRVEMRLCVVVGVDPTLCKVLHIGHMRPIAHITSRNCLSRIFGQSQQNVPVQCCVCSPTTPGHTPWSGLCSPTTPGMFFNHSRAQASISDITLILMLYPFFWIQVKSWSCIRQFSRGSFFGLGTVILYQ